MRPTMSDAEIEVLKEHLDQCSHYLESGCGGTTLMALESDSPKAIDVVETDIAWIEKLKERPEISKAINQKRIAFHNRDVGQVGNWGMPLDQTKRTNWPFFSMGFWDDIAGDVDLVFVDGRFRVATVLAALLMTTPNTRILVHDFKDRPYYNEMLEYADKVIQLDTLLVLERPSVFSYRSVLRAWSRYEFDVR